ncbi:PP2C family protein-serine/threonine phosphatase [Rariglobus hedericola]|uniref:Serine/threonine-protein phosphatase n=1 Tax=Rariglobus hedericola TaxID=2597822 RepID=A0A556QEM5_9BACT|nr:protein phosphatase 2C domain-containing protein [Rariglobus hedericola]TSJ75100.1 serine/threonine-protein phosphatase [Rariglobus hedericola]
MVPPRSPDDSSPIPFIHWSGMTHVGRVRANNEDSFLGVTVNGREVSYLGKIGESSLSEADFVFAVSDGMGGAKSGEFASRIALDKITKLLPKGFRLSAHGMASGFSDLLEELIASIHHELIKLGSSYEECAGMGATLSLCWFTPQWMYFAHIGDSRIYYLPKDGGITQISHDHSQVGWMRRAGQLNEREARNHPRRNALQQALGAGNQFIDPHLGAVGYRPGDRFVICSDGLVEGLWNHNIEELVRSPEAAVASHEPARRLVEQAVENSGADNTTAVVIEIRETAVP